ncbi:MAG: DAK2 domain-containing protein, partial [Clostridia bacterium]|nr:DAK2 domain-containing protein [Clostridia bacterium]
LGAAFSQGVRMAYSAVMTPSEGTILTVMREATEYACGQEKESTEDFLGAFIDEAKRSLERTPELLPVLKKAGVVDSGAAGLICIAEGMMAALSGERAEVTVADSSRENSKEPDPELFGEDDELQFGYCTELLVRLQSSKTDISNFDTRLFTEYLHTVGDSIVAVQNGSIVKLHIHTFAPDKVLAFCRYYGEFLKVKIENMMLQHNSGILTEVECKTEPARERKKYGIVAVANGEGLKQLFKDHGVDKVVEGGQSMNPSAEEFIAAFDEVNADNIIVFPNNSNVILAAKQAARLYSGSEVTVIESRNIGDGYCALCMMDTTSDDMNEIVRGLNDAMSGTVTVEISRCVREAMSERGPLHVGDYISFWGKKLLVSNTDRFAVLCQTLDALDISCCEICILICGKDSSSEEAEKFEKYVHANYRGKEVYIIDGGQDVYDYILVLE